MKRIPSASEPYSNRGFHPGLTWLLGCCLGFSDPPWHGACNHPESLAGCLHSHKAAKWILWPRKEKNERKGEWNYRPGWLHKSCISCFMACQKNSTPVDHHDYNCTWTHRAGGWVGARLWFVSVGACAPNTCMFFLAWPGVSNSEKMIKESYRNAHCSLAQYILGEPPAAHTARLQRLHLQM